MKMNLKLSLCDCLFYVCQIRSSLHMSISHQTRSIYQYKQLPSNGLESCKSSSNPLCAEKKIRTLKDNIQFINNCCRDKNIVVILSRVTCSVKEMYPTVYYILRNKKTIKALLLVSTFFFYRIKENSYILTSVGVQPMIRLIIH